MSKSIKMPKIPQFRQIIRDIKTEVSFSGLDENGEPVYDNSKPLPKLTFTGTVKLHGTNASIVISPENEVYAQSRKNVITPEKDNLGFASQVHLYRDEINDFMLQVKDELINHREYYTEVQDGIEDCHITIYGEWCGEGIQKGVAISKLPKMFVIFGCKVSPPGVGIDPTVSSYWINKGLESFNPELKWVHNIYKFQTYSVEIDFANPERSLEQLVSITDKVGECCPVGKYLGVEGIGEGVVWHCAYNGVTYRFKVKDARHSVSKVKTVTAISPEKLNSIDEFVEYACTRNRYEQGVKEVCGEDMDVKKTGELINWVKNDILSEESDVLKENDLTIKDVAGKISQRVKDWFFKEL